MVLQMGMDRRHNGTQLHSHHDHHDVRSGHTKLMGVARGRRLKSTSPRQRGRIQPRRISPRAKPIRKGGATLALHALPGAIVKPSTAAATQRPAADEGDQRGRSAAVAALLGQAAAVRTSEHGHTLMGLAVAPRPSATTAEPLHIDDPTSGVHQRLAAGAIVDERFELLDLLGEGSMSQVFRAHDISSGRVVALKIMHQRIAHDNIIKQRMRHEAQLTSSIISPHVVEIVTLGQLQDGRVYFAMELLDGETLDDMLLGPLPSYRTIVTLATQVAEGLAAAHSKDIVHRDLKPANIFVEHCDDGELRAKVLDFGVAKLANGQSLTVPGTVLGTPHYMAPEQALARAAVDGRADVYALGAIMFELCTGAPPFTADDTMALVMAHLTTTAPRVSASRPEIPIALSDVIARCLQKKPDDRYADGAALAAALRALGADAPHHHPGSDQHHDDAAAPAADTAAATTAPPHVRPRPRRDIVSARTRPDAPRAMPTAAEDMTTSHWLLITSLLLAALAFIWHTWL